MSELLNKSYSLAALLIHGSKQDVTADKIKAVFETLGLEYSSKIASMFALDAARYNSMLTSSTSSAPAVSNGAGSAAVAEPESEESEESSDNVMGF